jgi:hypothetical protein
VTTSLTVAAVVAIVVALCSRRPWRRAAVLLVLLCAVQVGLALRTNYASDPGGRRPSSAQGRYLVVLLVPVAVLAALACWRALARWSPRAVLRAALTTAAVGVVLHALLARSMFVGYWAGGSVAARADAVLAWSPWPEPISWAMLAAPLAALAAALASAWVRRARSPVPGGVGP